MHGCRMRRWRSAWRSINASGFRLQWYRVTTSGRFAGEMELFAGGAGAAAAVPERAGLVSWLSRGLNPPAATTKCASQSQR
jgi:hypothetical protein